MDSIQNIQIQESKNAKICYQSQYHLFCVKQRISSYFYARLAFGCRSSSNFFYQFSQAICWTAKNDDDIECILHLLDDFIIIDRPDYPAETTMAILTLIFKRLNVPLAKNKTMGQNTVMEYLGILLDSNLMQVRLPIDKVLRIREMLDSFYVKKSCTKREILHLCLSDHHTWKIFCLLLATPSIIST